MYSARECARRYLSNGGMGPLTTSFHCWRCGDTKAGDSWHCPVHQTDFCQECGGEISRMSLPRTWDNPVYVQERKEYNPPLTCTRAEIELLRKDLVEADAKGAEPVLRHDRPVREPGGLRESLPKGKRKGDRPAHERTAKGARLTQESMHDHMERAHARERRCGRPQERSGLRILSR